MSRKRTKYLFKNNLRFCDRSTCESPFKTGSYSLTSAKLVLLTFLLANFLLAAAPSGSAAAPPAQGGNLLQAPGFDDTAVNGVVQPWGKWQEERDC